MFCGGGPTFYLGENGGQFQGDTHIIASILSFKNFEELSCHAKNSSQYLNPIQFLDFCNSSAGVSLEKCLKFRISIPKVISGCL